MNGVAERSVVWNLWHGCHKFSEGCRYCYVYRGDAKRNVDSSVVVKTKNFDLPVRTNKNGSFKIPDGTLVYTCFTSDFFVEDADVWRTEAWEMIRQRSDLHFLMITKRISRVMECLPVDWKDGYDNVTICCTVENQLCADNRLPVYRAIPVKHKIIICEPLLEEISLDAYNIGEWVEQVVAGGESGYEARICNFDWIMKLHDICVKNNVSFWFKQTGSKFVKEGTLYTVKRQFQHSQARKAGINFK